MNAWIPAGMLGLLATGFALVSIVVSRVVGPRRYNRARLDPYECGVDTVPSTAGSRFPVRYYVLAMMFIVIDVEIVFVYPWAVSFDALRVFGYVEMLLFLLPLVVAYGYVWRRGGLRWD